MKRVKRSKLVLIFSENEVNELILGEPVGPIWIRIEQNATWVSERCGWERVKGRMRRCVWDGVKGRISRSSRLDQAHCRILPERKGPTEERHLPPMRLRRGQHDLIVATRLLHRTHGSRYRLMPERQRVDSVGEQVPLIVVRAETSLLDLKRGRENMMPFVVGKVNRMVTMITTECK